MTINRNRAFTLFALTALITALLLINMNGQTGAASPPRNSPPVGSGIGPAQVPQTLYLHGPTLTPTHMHGPPLTPIHMHSNITLTPVHLHTSGFIDLSEPICTWWHELYPNNCSKWHLTSWEDMDQNDELNPNDQIDMNLTLPDGSNKTVWFHVDRITVTLLLSGPYPTPTFETAEPTMAIELKWPLWYEPSIVYYPLGSFWHEVWPDYSNVYNLTSLYEVFPDGVLNPCDSIDLTNMSDLTVTYWHVEDIGTDLILRWKMMDPICTWWHELYPNYSTWWHLASLEESEMDEYPGRLSPSDQIDMNLTLADETNKTVWFHVDRVTVTINVTRFDDPAQWMMLELKTLYFDEMYSVFKHPLGSMWHEVYPDYSNVYNLTWWDPWDPMLDNCNGVLDPCDFIVLNRTHDGYEELYHIEDMCYDIILNKKIMNPICTDWIELYPDYDPPGVVREFHLNSWEDNDGDGRLSPCDQIDMNETGTEEISWWHVDRVTFTLNLSDWYEPWITKYIELKAVPFEYLYWVKIYPEWTVWHEVWPDYSNNYTLAYWEDNCNGVLDKCDFIELWDDGGYPSYWHVEGLAVDIILNKKITDPVCTDWWEVYPDTGTWYHLEYWEDNHDGVLSHCDLVNLTLQPGGPTKEYHVENVTLSINLADPAIPGQFYPMEYTGPSEDMYRAKTEPIGTTWTQWLIGPGGPTYTIEGWEDNCNGVLDHCDWVLIGATWYHVEEVAIDMIVTETVVPVHDVAVTHVSSKYPWVYQGATDPIKVNVTNLGNFDEPQVNVTAYYDGNPAAPMQTTSLSIGQTKTLTFNWNTSGVPPGVYTISASATIPVDDVPGNNYLSDGTQEVRERPPPPPPPEDLELYPPEVVDLEDPTDTQWHELYPNKTNYYQLTSRELGFVLSPEDQIDMYLVDPPVQVLMESEPPFFPWDPWGSYWHELEPIYCQMWQFTSWEDNDGDNMVSRSDQIDMIDLQNGYQVWFHVADIIEQGPDYYHMILDVKYWFQVDEVTVDMVLSPEEPGPQIFVEYKCGYWMFARTRANPICTKWNQIDPQSGPIRTLHLTSWIDNGNGVLDPCDIIDMTPLVPNPGPAEYYHVDFISISLMLSPKPSPPVVPPPPVGPLYLDSDIGYEDFDLADPVCTIWHEIYPFQGRIWHLSSWEDTGMLSPSDQIVLTLKDPITHEPIPGTETEYHVDKVTVAMNLTSMGPATDHIVKFEGSLKQFKRYYWNDPYGTQWHEVDPEYCRQWYLADWADINANNQLDQGDLILMWDKHTWEEEAFEVQSISTDIIISQKVCGVNITNIVPSESQAYPAWTIHVNVTVHNNGTIPCNYTVNAYYHNGTTWVQIGTKNITNLDPCHTKTLTFNWNLATVPYCNRAIKANATGCCGVQDELVDGQVKCKLPGDVDGSGSVTSSDLIFGLAPAYGSKPGDPNWNPQADFDQSGSVTSSDLIFGLAPNYGTVYC